MTLRQVARALGISAESVRNIEKRAMAKLRQALGSRFTGSIGPFLFDIEGVPDGGDDPAARHEFRKKNRYGSYRART